MNRCPYHPRVARRPASPTLIGRGSRLCVALSFLAAVTLPFPSAAAFANPFVQLQFLTSIGRGGVPLQMPLSVAVAPEGGEYAVANTGRGRIELLDRGGRPVAFFEHRVLGPDGTFVTGQPCGVCYDARDHLLVTDLADRDVDVLAMNGRSIGHIVLPSGPSPVGARFDSTAGAMARLRDGSLLVATRGNPARIVHFDPDGRFLSAWGEPGDAPGKLGRITALAQAPSGEIVVVCDGTELGVQRFDSTGAFLGGFGRHVMEPGNVSFPSGIAITPDGHMWLADQLRQTVQVYDAKGTYLGTAGEGGPDPGSFLYPTDVKADGSERLLVLDRVGARLQGFRILDFESAFQAPARR